MRDHTDENSTERTKCLLWLYGIASGDGSRRQEAEWACWSPFQRMLRLDGTELRFALEGGSSLIVGQSVGTHSMQNLGDIAMYHGIRSSRTYAASTRIQRTGLALPALASLLILPLQSVSAADQSSAEGVLQEIMVSARRVDESVLDVPVSISVLGAEQLEILGVHGFDDYGTKVPNLSFQYGGSYYGYAGNRSVTVRGVSGKNTTGFYIDDTPVPVALDPIVADLARIEVLKGPQGTLFGAGSMGGNVRLVTQPPTYTDELSYSASAGYTNRAATPDGRAVATGNISLIDDVVALRIVAAVEHQGGFVTRRYPERLSGQYELPASTLEPGSSDNQGAIVTTGGAVTLLVEPTENFSAKLRVMGQYEHTHGRAVQYAPLPSFTPIDSYTLPVVDNFQEYADNTWTLPSLELVYAGSNWSVTSSTSYFEQRIIDAEDNVQPDLDLVYAYSGVVLPPPEGGGDRWTQEHNTRTFNQEIRVGIDQVGPFRAIVGTRYAKTTGTNGYGDAAKGTGAYLPGLAAAGLYPTDLLWANWGMDVLTDKSIFGETYWRVGKVELTVGARKFWIDTDTNPDGNGFSDGYVNSGSFASGYHINPTRSSSEDGVSPKVALTYDVADNSMVYVLASKGFRPGGSNASLPSSCDAGLVELNMSAEQALSFKSDKLWNYEIGAKTVVGGMLLTAAAFQMDWSELQQEIIVPVCQTNILTLNVGKARVRGAEVELSGTLVDGLQVQLGLGYQKSELLSGGASELGSDQGRGSRLQGSPDFSGSIALTYTRPVSALFDGFISSDYAYQGSSISSVSNAERASFGFWNARAGLTWERNQLSLYLKNITNKMANLGDIARSAYPAVDATGEPLPQVVIPRPFQIGVQFTRGF